MEDFVSFIWVMMYQRYRNAYNVNPSSPTTVVTFLMGLGAGVGQNISCAEVILISQNVLQHGGVLVGDHIAGAVMSPPMTPPPGLCSKYWLTGVEL